jgi:hypothetical protein
LPRTTKHFHLGTTDTLLPNKGPSSSTKKCSFGYVCGLCSYILLGLFIFTLCLAAILGGGRFGAIPVISRTGSIICLGISIGTALILLVQCTVFWICISGEKD